MDQYKPLITNVHKEFVNKKSGEAMNVQWDHSMDYQPRTNGQYQTEFFGNQACIQLEGHAVSLSFPSNGASLLAQAVHNRRALLEREKNEREKKEREKKRGKKNTNPPEERDIGEGDERESEVPEDIDEGDGTQEQQSNYFGSSSTSWNKSQLFYSVLSDEK